MVPWKQSLDSESGTGAFDKDKTMPVPTPREVEIDEGIAEGYISPAAFRQLLELSELLKGELTWQRGSHSVRFSFRGGKAFWRTVMTIDEIRENQRRIERIREEGIARGKSEDEIGRDILEDYFQRREGQLARSDHVTEGSVDRHPLQQEAQVITLEKLAIYQEHKCDPGLWARAGRPGMTKDDWSKIQYLLHDLLLLKRGLVSPDYADRIRQELSAVVADAATAQAMMDMA